MNFFYSIKTNTLASKLTIPRFRNNSNSNKEYNVFSLEIKNNKWHIKKLNCEANDNFFYLSGKMLDNNTIIFLAKDNELKQFRKYDFELLIDLNNYTNTVPDYRANLMIYNSEGGFSSYQSDYPFSMVNKTGNIISPINALTNLNAQTNIIFFKNIFIKPIIAKFKLFFIDIIEKRILFEKSIFTNTTNAIEIEKKFINPNVYLYSSKYLGVPMFVSCLNGHISFEHTHPPQEYIFSKSKFRIIGELKEEFNEIIDKENC